MRTNNDLKYTRAKHRVQREKSFYTHLTVFVLVNLGITAFKVYGHLSSWDDFLSELLTFNVLSSWLVWGIIITFHYVMFRFGGAWEEKKINEYMDKDLSNK